MTYTQQLAVVSAQLAALQSAVAANQVTLKAILDIVNKPIITVPPQSITTELASSSRPASSGDVRS